MAVTMVIFAIMAYFYKYVSFEREYELADGRDDQDLVPNMAVATQEQQAAPEQVDVDSKPAVEE